MDVSIHLLIEGGDTELCKDLYSIQTNPHDPMYEEAHRAAQAMCGY